MSRKHAFNRQTRRLILRMLDERLSLEQISERILPPGSQNRFCQLPERMKKELYMLEAKYYLKNHPDATRDERRLVRAWVRAGHHPWDIVWKDVVDDFELSMDFLEFEQFLKAEPDILPLCSKEYIEYFEGLPF